MADVLEFKRPEKGEPHCTGEVRCIDCEHRWVGVAPVGTRWLECPECKLLKGAWYCAVEGSPGDVEYRCAHCESIAMTAFKRDGLFRMVCMGCGFDHTESLFGE